MGPLFLRLKYVDPRKICIQIIVGGGGYPVIPHQGTALGPCCDFACFYRKVKNYIVNIRKLTESIFCQP